MEACGFARLFCDFDSFSSAVLGFQQVLREILVTFEVVVLHKLSMLIISHTLDTDTSWT